MTALENLQAVTRGLHLIANIRQMRRHFIEEARLQMWLAAQKEKNDKQKVRYRIVFELRNKGRTFREIGEVIGVNRARASQLFQVASSYAKRGWLYSGSQTQLVTEIETYQ